jgi:hypothetical protein
MTLKLYHPNKTKLNYTVYWKENVDGNGVQCCQVHFPAGCLFRIYTIGTSEVTLVQEMT